MRLSVFSTLILISTLCIFSASAKSVKEGDIINVSLHELRPTQPSVGFDQIMYKLGRYQFEPQKMFDDICETNGQKGIIEHQANAHPNKPETFTCELHEPTRNNDLKTVVIAPNSNYFLTDGHHTLNTFYQMPLGGPSLKINVVVAKDYRHLTTMEEFWSAMIEDGNTWLFDHNGNSISTKQLPTSLGLVNFTDDPYRSLMYFSRGISWKKPKNSIPFIELYWSHELRKGLDAPIFDSHSSDGYEKAVAIVSDYVVTLQSNNVGGSNLSEKHMGQLNKYDQNAFNKLFKERGKIDYLLKYKGGSKCLRTDLLHKP